MKGFTIAGMALGAALAAATAISNAAESWTGYCHTVVPTAADFQGLERIVRKVGADTHGQLKIDLHLAGTLQIKPSNITQAVGDGVIQFASDGYFLGNVPIGGVLRLPMLINSDEEWAKAYKAMEPFLKKAFEKQGVVYLGQYRYPKQTVFTTFRIASLDDLKGKKIRVTADEQGALIKLFGGFPLPLPGTEVPTSLERGVISGLVTASSGGAKNWHEFLKYNYRFNTGYFNSVVIANREAFERLPASSRAALASDVAAEMDRISAEFNADEQTQMAAQKKAGMTIVEPDAVEVTRASRQMEPYWVDWAKSRGPEFQDALGAVRKALGK